MLARKYRVIMYNKIHPNDKQPRRNQKPILISEYMSARNYARLQTIWNDKIGSGKFWYIEDSAAIT
jgi:hypothetical protein